MVRARVTHSDPTMPHQIKLRFKQAHNQITLVMCNCRPEPLGEMPNNGDPWPIYNDPSKHSHHREVFVPREHHTANQKVYNIE